MYLNGVSVGVLLTFLNGDYRLVSTVLQVGFNLVLVDVDIFNSHSYTKLFTAAIAGYISKVTIRDILLSSSDIALSWSFSVRTKSN